MKGRACAAHMLLCAGQQKTVQPACPHAAGAYAAGATTTLTTFHTANMTGPRRQAFRYQTARPCPTRHQPTPDWSGNSRIRRKRVRRKRAGCTKNHMPRGIPCPGSGPARRCVIHCHSRVLRHHAHKRHAVHRRQGVQRLIRHAQGQAAITPRSQGQANRLRHTGMLARRVRAVQPRHRHPSPRLCRASAGQLCVSLE